MKLDDFEVLTFDCYGTLIDWETGILQELKPWLSQNNVQLSDDAILQAYASSESKIETDLPDLPYTDVLYRVYQSLAKEWNIPPSDDEATKFSLSVKNWPAFADSQQALQILARHYKLVILSNIDNQSLQYSVAKLGVQFEYLFTAHDIGSYKPSQRNFQYLLDKLAASNIPPNKILHTAQSLFHDHVPAKAMGLATCWINRRHDKQGWGATPQPSQDIKPDFQFNSMAAMAEARQQTD